MNQWSGSIDLSLIYFLLFQFLDRASLASSLLSAERQKIVLLILDLNWDNSVEMVEFPFRAVVLSLRGEDVFLVFF